MILDILEQSHLIPEEFLPTINDTNGEAERKVIEFIEDNPDIFDVEGEIITSVRVDGLYVSLGNITDITTRRVFEDEINMEDINAVTLYRYVLENILMNVKDVHFDDEDKTNKIDEILNRLNDMSIGELYSVYNSL